MHVGKYNTGSDGRVSREKIEDRFHRPAIEIVGHPLPNKQSLEIRRTTGLRQAISKIVLLKIDAKAANARRRLAVSSENTFFAGDHRRTIDLENGNMRQLSHPQRSTIKPRAQNYDLIDKSGKCIMDPIINQPRSGSAGGAGTRRPPVEIALQQSAHR